MNEKSSEEKNITEHPKIEAIEVPKNTEKSFFIPCNNSGYGFLLL